MYSKDMTKSQRRKARKYARIKAQCIQAARSKPLVASTGTGRPTDGFKLQTKPGSKAQQSKPTPAGNWQGKIRG